MTKIPYSDVCFHECLISHLFLHRLNFTAVHNIPLQAQKLFQTCESKPTNFVVKMSSAEGKTFQLLPYAEYT